MAVETPSPVVLRFGAFELDLRAGELHKKGLRVKLQEQPFRVLTLLIQRPGELVTREEFRSQIWPADTFVDFDNSLNTSINKLRETLGDSAESPHFIETLPRRGYRFIAPVSSSDRKAPTQAWKIVVAVVAVAALVAGGLFWRSRQARRLTEKDTIVLGDFTNSTGDTVFDGTLREGLSVQLEQSPFLSLVSAEGIHQTLRMMGQPANARLTPEVTHEVCQRTNSRAALDTSIALIGTRYDLILKAVNCANGDLLTSTEAQANDKSHVLDALSKAASELRSKLGESLSTVERYNTTLEQATTPSLEALQAYSLGMKMMAAEDNSAALALFQRATRLDPQFAMAYWAIGIDYALIGESTLAAENIARAFNLRGAVSEFERLNIEGDYYQFVTGDLTKAQRNYILGTQTYPREAVFHMDLGTLFNILGQYEDGLRENIESSRLEPYNNLFCRYVAFTYLLLDRVEEAAEAARAQPTKCVDSKPTDVLYEIAFYRHDSTEMARQVASFGGKTGQEDLLLELDADTEAYYGHLERARELSRRAAASAERAGRKETAGDYRAVSGFRETLFGNAAAARQIFSAVAKEALRGRESAFAAAIGLAYIGDTRQAQVVADDLNRRFAQDSTMQFNFLSAVRAKIALNRANSQDALQILQAAEPYELGLPSLGFYNWPNLYPVYVRGEAYLAAHRGHEAAAEFQKILDHRGIVLNEPIGALAQLQLGRAYALQGDTAKARSVYNDFLTLWKDADPDIPILKQAKAEYAKLQ
jgi:DNA-binding winged helix-turn-helix (wHTH) protein/tetratricopeptide (TPR) repeat protein